MEDLAAKLIQYGLPILLVGGFLHRRLARHSVHLPARAAAMAAVIWVIAIAVTSPDTAATVGSLIGGPTALTGKESAMAVRMKVATEVLILFLPMYAIAFRKTPIPGNVETQNEA